MPKPYPHPKYRNYIITGYRKTRLNKYVQQSIADSFSYHIDVTSHTNIIKSLSDIKSITIRREFKKGEPDELTALWATSRENIIQAKFKDWQPSIFYYPDDNVGGLLEFLILLSLKSLFDYFSSSKNDIRAVGNTGYYGVLFRSEILRLKDSGRFRDMDTNVNSHISYLINAGTDKASKGTRHKEFLPLRDQFLADVSEIYNLICTGGRTGKNKENGHLYETAWVLNVLPKHIRLLNTKGIPFKTNTIPDVLSEFFSEGILLSDEDLKRYAALAKKEEYICFDQNREYSITEPSEEFLDDLDEKLEETFDAKSEKPDEILSFDDVLKMHPLENFIGRKDIINQIQSYTTSKSPASPLLFVLGDSGIGKTALTASLILSQEDRIHYFCQSKHNLLDLPLTMIRHLYTSLSYKYGLTIKDCSSSLQINIRMFENRMKEISENELQDGEKETIYIDALDEFRNDSFLGINITEILHLDIPTNFIFIITSCSFVELNEFIKMKDSPVINLYSSSNHNRDDLELFYRKNLEVKKLSDTDLQKRLRESEGTFQYANTIVQMFLDDEISVKDLPISIPEDLENLYEFKMSILDERLFAKQDIINIWNIMRTISLLKYSTTPNTICEILNIDPVMISIYFAPFEKFLNQYYYHSELRKCKWAHQSFNNFILDKKRFNKKDKNQLVNLIISHFEKKITNFEDVEDLPEWELIYYCRDIFLEYQNHEKSFLKSQEYFMLFKLNEPYEEFFGQLLYSLFEYSILEKDPKNIIYFGSLICLLNPMYLDFEKMDDIYYSELFETDKTIAELYQGKKYEELLRDSVKFVINESISFEEYYSILHEVINGISFTNMKKYDFCNCENEYLYNGIDVEYLNNCSNISNYLVSLYYKT